MTVTGLTLGTAYTFKVKGANSTATGPESSASSSFTPTIHSSYESIASYTVSGSSTSTITFSSIPATYKHLQIRATTKCLGNYGVATSCKTVFNSDTTVANYYGEYITNQGSSPLGLGSSATNSYSFYSANNNNTNIFSGVVIDIFDYASTTFKKGLKSYGGYDAGSQYSSGTYGSMQFAGSMTWNNTAAITTIALNADDGNWAPYSTFALYGIKG
jgi:hypothetical protein